MPEHIRPRLRSFQFRTRGEAAVCSESLAVMWAGVRYFHRDGRMLQDGVSVEEAFRRARAM
jgi:hypothetical protein